ncbi:alpha/beta hydrolase [Roseateles sp. BYS96W]|uniref:Alpha/beta hydrolase n=1 Tax=Pelomonas nitida TaxID=3299027 RepID=A0ABW7GD72_9BURK
MNKQNSGDNKAATDADRREFMKRTGVMVAMGSVLTTTGSVFAADTKAGASVISGADNFFKSDKLNVESVTFKTQYGVKVGANLYTPKGMVNGRKYPAIAVSHPMGAVKEQSANLYAQKLAEQGFVTLSLDLPFWGDSEGAPRQAVSPDVYSEGFSAAVDFLGTRAFVDRERIGVLGVCGSGSFAVSAAKIDPRMKAVATVSMYDMGSAYRNGLQHGVSLEDRKKRIAEAALQRYVDFTGGESPILGLPLTLSADADPITREFFDFYRTPRGASVPKGSTLAKTTGRRANDEVKFANFYPFNDIETISPRPMLFITGDVAHSKEFSEDAYKRAAEPKELYYVKGAGHVDLYDRVTLIPFEKLTAFFTQHLAQPAA